MSTMTTTMIGAYKYDPTIFDEMILPDTIERETAINTILTRCGEFELLYPDLDFLKGFIGLWSKKWYRTFELWEIGTKASWNPVENYDRYEDFTDTGSSSKTIKGTHGETNSSNLSGSSSNDTTDYVSAYDASTFQNSTKETSGGTTSSNSSGSSNTSINDTETGTDSNIHTGRIHGNIGVTQASDMLAGWYDISAWSLYDHIADVFVAEMCIPIY